MWARCPAPTREAIAFLRGECSTACGGAGADGTYLEVAESEDPTKGLLAEVILFSTREGEWAYVGTLSEEEPREDHYVFAAAGSSEPVAWMAARVKPSMIFRRPTSRPVAANQQSSASRAAPRSSAAGQRRHLAEIDAAGARRSPSAAPSEARCANAEFARALRRSAPAPDSLAWEEPTF